MVDGDEFLGNLADERAQKSTRVSMAEFMSLSRGILRVGGEYSERFTSLGIQKLSRP